MTRKGQVTIPEEIRRAKGVEPGTLVTIDVDKEKIVIRKSEKSVASQTAGIWAGKINPDYYKQLRREGERRISRKGIV